jgi:hypothetical protein
MSKEITIPIEIADGITVASLQEQLSYLKEEIRLHTEESRYMHPEDYHNSMTKYIPAMELLIKYFGGEVK